MEMILILAVIAGLGYYLYKDVCQHGNTNDDSNKDNRDLNNDGKVDAVEKSIAKHKVKATTVKATTAKATTVAAKPKAVVKKTTTKTKPQ